MINGLSENFIKNYNMDNTISGQIKRKLEDLSMSNGKKINIENEHAPISTYHLGTDSAKIYKRLNNGTVGEENGTIKYYAESADIKRLDWWKSVLADMPISFLETPINDFAKQAYISKPELIFSPEEVIAHYRLNPTGDDDSKIAAKQWVVDKVINTLTPLLAPDYKLQFYEGHIRLIPLTQDAMESREIDNLTYDKAKEVIANSIGLLQSSYQTMSEKLNQ